MDNEIVADAAPTMTGAVDDRLNIVRSTSDEMSMTELVQWMGVNFGTMSAREALQQAAFMLCCDVISQDIAKAPLRMREYLPNGTSRIVLPREHPTAAFLALEPNHRHTWFNFHEMMVLWLCLTKNCYAPILRNGVGDVLELIPVMSSSIIELAQPTGPGAGVYYDVTAPTWAQQELLGTNYMRVPQRDMIHVRSRLLDGMDGYSTLIAGRSTLETGDAIEDFRGGLFSDDGELRGVFRKKSAGALDDRAFARLKQQLRVAMTRLKSGSEPLVIEDDMEFQPIASKPNEMELTKQFQEQILATCRLLRVPPHKVFNFDGTKYENLEPLEMMYVGDTLVPIALPYEQAFAKALLSKKDRLNYFLEFDREAMTLRDSKALTDRVVRSAGIGLIEIDEGRAKLGLNPLPNGQGQTRLIPVNMQVVDRNGDVVVQASQNQMDQPPAADAAAADEPKKDAPPQLRVVS